MKKEFTKKLQLNKKTIVNLSPEESKEVQGGGYRVQTIPPCVFTHTKCMITLCDSSPCC
jgi:hypothetical protein